MINYIQYLQHAGAIRRADGSWGIKTPNTVKEGLLDMVKVAKGVGTAALLPLASLLSCSGSNCWHTMDNLGKYDPYPFLESPSPIEWDPSTGTYINHGKKLTYNSGEEYNGEAKEGFVSLLGLNDGGIADISFNRYYDKPDSIHGIMLNLTKLEYQNLITKYPQFKNYNTLGKVLKLTDFYNALR